MNNNSYNMYQRGSRRDIRSQKRRSRTIFVAAVLAVLLLCFAIGAAIVLDPFSQTASNATDESTSDAASNDSGTSAPVSVPAGVDTTSPATSAATSSATTTSTTTTTAAVTTTSSLKVGRTKPLVCIDPGHGFDDPGTDSDYLGDEDESTIVFDVALKLRDILTAAGYDVFLTHDTNARPSDAPAGQYLFGLEKRTVYANSLQPDLYVSIHCDSYKEAEYVNGARIYYKTHDGEDSSSQAALAQCVYDSVTAAFPDVKAPMLKAMTVYDETYYVLNHTECTALLVEIGFVSNKTEAANMLSDSWRQSMASALGTGVVNYLKTHNPYSK